MMTNEFGAPCGTMIECHEVTKSFPPVGRARFRSSEGDSAGALVVGPIDLAVGKGEIVSLLGPSGCGKSTLLRMIAGLISVTSGELRVENLTVRSPQTQIGMAFQRPALLEWMRVLENVMLQGASRSGLSRQTIRSRAEYLLQAVGLKQEVGSMRPSQLSGGMQQRVSICRAIVHNPSILLMDEPFGALDALTRDQIVVDLEPVWTNRTVLIVTHSIEEAVLMSDRVIVLTPAPARIDLDLAIKLPRPRGFSARSTLEFAAYTDEIRDAFTRRGVLRRSESGEGESATVDFRFNVADDLVTRKVDE